MTLFGEAVRIPVRRPGEAPLEGPRTDAVSAQADGARASEAARSVRTDSETSGAPEQAPADSVDWRAATMRLNAEMQNYRRRQQRWAEDEAAREKARLLLEFLRVVDSLELSIEHLDPQDPVHQGVQLAYDTMVSLLAREGVERISAQGQMFNPDLHEAVATVPVRSNGAADMHVTDVLLQGYRFEDRVLRHAKVVVARG